MKANPKPKTATQRDAAAFLRAAKRLLKVFRDNPPTSDEGYIDQMARAKDLEELIGELETIHNWERD